jgi:DNA primase
VIPQSFIQDLLARVDIVDVVERYVKLRKAGANYSACCPFHSEKTPSFTVSQSKQFYHCFGCGAHGSAIGFVMEYAGLGFIEAVQELAASAGLQVPYQKPEGHGPKPDKAASLTDILARAARYYREQLKASPKAIDYLKGRGLTGEIAARFGVGYAPEGWQNLEHVFSDYRAPELAEAGLVIDHEQGRRYDRFRDRIMFPIQDSRGNVIGFGGRVLGAGEPKYLNSPETPLFQKGNELYGLPQARESIRAHDTVIVVEGYMDVVALAQHGIGNAVATLGTATTGSHVQKLLRQAARVVFCFDGDTAGRKAAWRALEASIEHLTENKGAGFLFLPAEHDPDSFVREQGADAFRRLAAQATPLSEFLLQDLRSRGNPAGVEGRSRILHDAKPLLARIQAPILRLQLTRALADLTRTTSQEIESVCELRPLVRAVPMTRAVARRAPPSIARTLLKIVLQKPGWAPGLPFEQLPSDGEGAALRALCDAVDHGEIPAGNIATIIEFFRGSEHSALLDEVAIELETENFEESAMEAVFNDALEQLQRVGLTREIAALSAKAGSSGLNPEERQRLAQLLSSKQRLREPGPDKGL